MNDHLSCLFFLATLSVIVGKGFWVDVFRSCEKTRKFRDVWVQSWDLFTSFAVDNSLCRLMFCVASRTKHDIGSQSQNFVSQCHKSHINLLTVTRFLSIWMETQISVKSFNLSLLPQKKFVFWCCEIILLTCVLLCVRNYKKSFYKLVSVIIPFFICEIANF